MPGTEHESVAAPAATSISQLLSPTEGEPADGSAATFEWTPVRGASAYRLQIANDAAFEETLRTIEARGTTLLTLYEMLPEDGTAYFWRVQAQTREGWQPWSEAASFTAATDEEVYAFASREAKERAVGSAETEPPPVEEEPPYRTEHTSGAAILGFFALMIVSFAITFFLGVRAVDRMQAGRDVQPTVQTTEQTPADVDQAMDRMVREARDRQDLELPE